MGRPAHWCSLALVLPDGAALHQPRAQIVLLRQSMVQLAMRTIASLLPHCFHGNDAWKHSRTLHEKRCSSQVFSGAPEGIRTPDPQIRSLVLYPAELPAPLEEKGGAPEEIRTPDPQIRSFKVRSDLGGHSPTYVREINYDPQSFLTLRVMP